jgi:hypothetical protein
MVNITININSSIPNYIRQLEEVVKRETAYQAKELLTDMKSVCPVRTGFLRSSGVVNIDELPGSISATIAFEAFYAVYVEHRVGYMYSTYVSKEVMIVNGIIQAINGIR